MLLPIVLERLRKLNKKIDNKKIIKIKHDK